MELIDTIDLDGGHDFTASKACYNCNATAAHGTWLSEYMLPDGTEVLACDDCIVERERMEREGNEMAAKPSCEERQRIIDRAQSTAQLVNALRAHDQTGCLGCAAAPDRRVQRLRRVGRRTATKAVA